MTDIPDGWAVVLAAALGTAGGIVALVGAWLARVGRRLRRLEQRDRLNWLYIRALIDSAYKHGATPLPDPPPGWLDDDPTNER